MKIACIPPMSKPLFFNLNIRLTPPATNTKQKPKQFPIQWCEWRILCCQCKKLRSLIRPPVLSGASVGRVKKRRWSIAVNHSNSFSNVVALAAIAFRSIQHVKFRASTNFLSYWTTMVWYLINSRCAHCAQFAVPTHRRKSSICLFVAKIRSAGYQSTNYLASASCR